MTAEARQTRLFTAIVTLGSALGATSCGQPAVHGDGGRMEAPVDVGRFFVLIAVVDNGPYPEAQSPDAGIADAPKPDK